MARVKECSEEGVLDAIIRELEEMGFLDVTVVENKESGFEVVARRREYSETN